MHSDNDIWYRVDTTHASYASMLASAEGEHQKNWPHSELSVLTNNAETEAIIKVRAGGNFAPGWEDTPLVLQKYNSGNHDLIVSLMRTEPWVRPDPPGI